MSDSPPHLPVLTAQKMQNSQNQAISPLSWPGAITDQKKRLRHTKRPKRRPQMWGDPLNCLPFQHSFILLTIPQFPNSTTHHGECLHHVQHKGSASKAASRPALVRVADVADGAIRASFTPNTGKRYLHQKGFTKLYHTIPRSSNCARGILPNVC